MRVLETSIKDLLGICLYIEVWQQNAVVFTGKKQKIELIRDGRKIQDITNEDNFNYDKPITHRYILSSLIFHLFAH